MQFFKHCVTIAGVPKPHIELQLKIGFMVGGNIDSSFSSPITFVSVIQLRTIWINSGKDSFILGKSLL